MRPQKPVRSGKPIHVWVDASIKRAMAAFIAAQRMPPSNTDVVELALSEFLTREGFPPASYSGP